MIPSTLFSWAELHWQQYQGTFFRWDYHKTADYSFLRACNIKSRACNIKPWTCNIKPRACNIKPRACNIKSRACNITWYILTRAWYIRVRASYIKSRTCNLRPELATLKTRTCNLRDRNLQPYGTELATLRNRSSQYPSVFSSIALLLVSWSSTWLLFPHQTMMTNSSVLSYLSFNSSVFHVKSSRNWFLITRATSLWLSGS